MAVQSAGTNGGLELALSLRQAWIAAYYANDVVGIGAAPLTSATQLGFAPWGQAASGGNVSLATAIVDAMRSAGYRLPTPAPYNGPGSTMHGSLEQQADSMRFCVGKTRQ